MAHSLDPHGPPEQVGLPARRSFLRWLAAAAGAAAGVFLAVPLVRYLADPLRRPPVDWVPLGPVSKFPVNQTRFETFDNPIRQPWDGMTANTGVYVRHLGEGRFLVFAVNCAHLGCPVEWFPQSGLFMCPCHGGVYYEDGSHASGPPPRGLFHCVWQVNKGQLEIQAPHLPTLHNTLTRPA
ncbi:MAG TPA: Rieske (2Fe-2S) protein [Gemmataceae bacterium]|nr:Rieske (2Fe-2S) protein [Gemmataceae bacterium]